MDDLAVPNGNLGETGRRGPGRKENSVRTEQITLSLPPAQREMLEELTNTGYFGRNAVETATMLLWQALSDCATRKLEEMQALKGLHELRQGRDLKQKVRQIASIVNDE
jgi:Arc/MetJ-type ribon-helix-helix transcriptional regulator